MKNPRAKFKIEHFSFFAVSATIIYLLTERYDLLHIVYDYGAYISFVAFVFVVLYEALMDRNRIKPGLDYWCKFLLLFILSVYSGTIFVNVL